MRVLVLNFRELAVTVGSGKTHCTLQTVCKMGGARTHRRSVLQNTSESIGLYYWDAIVQILSCNNHPSSLGSVYTQYFISDSDPGILHTWYLLPQLYMQVAQTGPRKYQGGIARETREMQKFLSSPGRCTDGLCSCEGLSLTFARKLQAAYCPEVVLLFSFTVCNIRKNPNSPLQRMGKAC